MKGAGLYGKRLSRASHRHAPESPFGGLASLVIMRDLSRFFSLTTERDENMYHFRGLRRIVFKVAALSLPVLILASAAGRDALAGGSPLALVPEPRFEFAPVLDGTEVTHDFVVRNRGGSSLVINRVHTG